MIMTAAHMSTRLWCWCVLLVVLSATTAPSLTQAQLMQEPIIKLVRRVPPLVPLATSAKRVKPGEWSFSSEHDNSVVIMTVKELGGGLSNRNLHVSVLRSAVPAESVLHPKQQQQQQQAGHPERASVPSTATRLSFVLRVAGDLFNQAEHKYNKGSASYHLTTLSCHCLTSLALLPPSPQCTL